MNKYAVVFFPRENLIDIQKFREKHDPKANLIAPHITLAFPFVTGVNEDELVQEIESRLADSSSFSIELQGTHLDVTDNFLHLIVKENSERVVALHDKIYSGLLEVFWRRDLKYVPHMTIGVFSDEEGRLDEAKYLDAMDELKKTNAQVSLSFNRLTLIKIEDSKRQRVVVKDFELE